VIVAEIKFAVLTDRDWLRLGMPAEVVTADKAERLLRADAAVLPVADGA
jgi:hypothetical protein